MSFSFGKRSLSNLVTCHPDLIKIANELIKEMDVAVICGHRGKEEQNAAVKRGASKLKWPKSKHNSLPSQAMDVCPSPIDWNDIAAFKEMCLKIEEIAKRLNIPIRLGRDFSFRDWPHIELLAPITRS